MFELAPARSYSQTRPAKGWPKLGWLAMDMVMTMGLAMAMAIATAVATTIGPNMEKPQKQSF